MSSITPLFRSTINHHEKQPLFSEKVKFCIKKKTGINNKDAFISNTYKCLFFLTLISASFFGSHLLHLKLCILIPVVSFTCIVAKIVLMTKSEQKNKNSIWWLILLGTLLISTLNLGVFAFSTTKIAVDFAIISSSLFGLIVCNEIYKKILKKIKDKRAVEPSAPPAVQTAVEPSAPPVQTAVEPSAPPAVQTAVEPSSAKQIAYQIHLQGGF